MWRLTYPAPDPRGDFGYIPRHTHAECAILESRRWARYRAKELKRAGVLKEDDSAAGDVTGLSESAPASPRHFNAKPWQAIKNASAPVTKDKTPFGSAACVYPYDPVRWREVVRGFKALEEDAEEFADFKKVLQSAEESTGTSGLPEWERGNADKDSSEPIPTLDEPEFLRATLLPYQKEGLYWLVQSEQGGEAAASTQALRG